MSKIVNHVLVCIGILSILEHASALPLDHRQSIGDFRKEMLDALNAKRKEFGFKDEFQLAKTVGDDEKSLDKMAEGFCPTNFRFRTPNWIDVSKFSKSRPLSLQLDYWDGESKEDFSIRMQNADDYTPEWKKLMNQVTAKRMVDFWAAQTVKPSEEFKGRESKYRREFGGEVLYNARSSAEGVWPFVTSTADQNVVITRANCGDGYKCVAFTVLFPGYDKVEVPAADRRKLAADKAYELCKPTDDEKAKICDEKFLTQGNGYEAYKEVFKKFRSCANDKLFFVFAQTGDFRTEMVAKRVCGDDELFTRQPPKEGGLLKKKKVNEFEKALNAKGTPFISLGS